MTSPLTQGPPGGIPSAQPQVISGGGIDQYLPLIVQILAQSSARKQRKAEEAVQGIPEGTTYGSLTPDQQKAYQRATGVKDLKPDTIVRPLPATSDEAALNRLTESLGIAPGSTAYIGLRTALAKKTATGAPSAPTTPEAVAVETAASADVAQARGVEARTFRGAVERTAAAAPGQNVEYTPAELQAYQRFNTFVPSQPIADQLTGQTRAEVMKQALRIAGDPSSATWAKLLPEGITPADVIGGIALGVGDIITSGINKRNIVEATYAQEAARALFDVAGKASTAMGAKYSPDFIAQVMQGNPKAINTPAGQMVSRFLDAGFVAGLTESAAKGDPVSTIQTRLLELARVPQISSNERLLAIYSDLFREMEAGKFARRDLGFDITDVEPGSDAAKLWLKYQAKLVQSMGGMFRTGRGGFLWTGTRITGVGTGQPGNAPEQSQQERDAALLEQSLQALFGDSTGVLPGQPGSSSAPSSRPGSPFNLQTQPGRVGPQP